MSVNIHTDTHSQVLKRRGGEGRIKRGGRIKKRKRGGKGGGREEKSERIETEFFLETVKKTKNGSLIVGRILYFGNECTV